ncbi:Hypoxanthine phosphoribosyltransferase [Candidatus Westeberhardia cardiocondylae]|uniref:Hypoxanthine phosphoribosyltransferase n=1 Tax=Candidatus Westeberhardia cardiocondylae TaxID=1594731 RepID=A0A0H5BWJ8_9ENTR|nr:hypoxanthine phosphoribosyltransferase [Candidatus Westeberhardia cardiocondylae]CEN32097.1 Hypoxanthine phosphoribosyltransferase [Candidatus Westeberhardia cardiocondylae]
MNLRKKYNIKILFSKEKIARRIKELGKSISEYYHNSHETIILIGLLKGSFIFIADLCRAITLPHKIDFIITSSYGNSIHSNKNIKILKNLEENIYKKHVLIIEDIIDSGNTLNQIQNILLLHKPKSLSICTLLDKPKRRETNIFVQWTGFTISDEFVVGYGIDYAQYYRHLPYLGKIIKI